MGFRISAGRRAYASGRTRGARHRSGRGRGGPLSTLLEVAIAFVARKRRRCDSPNENRPSFMSYGLSGALADWGWVYETTNNGSWVNASIPPGNNGDITDL
jgi:hypothetical protein